MSDKVKVFHNPQCSKSRATLALLNEKNIEVEVIQSLDTPPDRDTLLNMLSLLSIEPRELMRTGESIYKELKLESEMDNDKLIDAMVSHPVLIERPVVIRGNKATLGRPPTRILDIL